MKKREEILVFTLILGIILFTGLNAVKFFFRIDLTDTKAFTISQVSKDLFQDIPQNIQITYYISDKLKKVSPVPDQIEDMLYEYASFSRGKINISVYEPEKKGRLDDIEKLGIYPQQMEIVEKNEKSVAKIYSGIVIEYLDQYEVLPFVLQLQTLEYELTSKIKGILHPEVKSIGILVGDLSRSTARDYSYLYQQLTSGYTVKEVKPGEDIPPDIKALLVLGNKDLDAFDVYPIDQWVMKGGRALFCVDGVYVDIGDNLNASDIKSSSLLDMLATWGIEVDRGIAMDEACRNFRVPKQLFGGIAWQVIGKYPPWIAVGAANTSKNSILTARFSGLDLLWASPLQIKEKPGLSYDTILNTSVNAWIMRAPYNTNPYTSEALNQGKGPENKQYPLGCLIEGELPSFFAGKEVPAREGVSSQWDNPIEKSPKTQIIVIGDTDFASNVVQYSDSSYNMQFLNTVADWLSNDDDLLTIKTRVLTDTRLTKIQNPEKLRRTYNFAKWLNIVFIPVIIILLGLKRFISRKRKEVFYHGEVE